MVTETQPYSVRVITADISHTDANHTDKATFPTKHTYTYIRNVKTKKGLFCSKSRSLCSSPIT